MLLTAIHAIERGETASPSRVQPGATWNPTDQEKVDLIAMRAARPANDAEIAAFEARSKGAPVVATPEPSSRDLLEARAKELGVAFRANVSDETLAERVAEAEAKAKAEADAAAAKDAGAGNDSETLI